MKQLVIDAGQTGVRVRQLEESHSSDFDYSGLRTSEPIAPQMLAIIKQHSSSANFNPASVSIAMTGLTSPEETTDAIFSGLKPLGVSYLAVVHDSISGYLGALGKNLGAVTASGTGVVTLAVGASNFSRVDGWGNIMGDAGSGYWIGRAALDSAMRSYDGRLGKTELLGVMREHFPDVEEAYIELQQDPDRVARVASFARYVFDLADRDEVAMNIIKGAASELNIAISAGLKNVGFTRADSPFISWAGKIATNPLMAKLLKSGLEEAWPNSNIIEPLGEPIDGVALVSSIDKTNPLYNQIHIREI